MPFLGPFFLAFIVVSSPLGLPCDSEAPRRDDAAAAGHGEEHQDLEGGGFSGINMINID